MEEMRLLSVGEIHGCEDRLAGQARMTGLDLLNGFPGSQSLKDRLTVTRVPVITGFPIMILGSEVSVE
jgi:hypothetical protein